MTPHPRPPPPPLRQRWRGGLGVRQVSYRSLRVWQRNRDALLRLWKTDALPIFIEPLVDLAAMGVGVGSVVGEVNGESYFDFIAPGVLAAYVMFSPVFENSWGSYVRMAVRRMYDAIIATPLTIEDVITGEILWGTTRAVMIGAVILVILAAAGLATSPLAVLVLPFAALEGFLFASLAMTFTAKAPSVNAFNYFYSLFVYPMYFFSGVFFPLDALPDAAQRFAWLLPLTPAVHVTRGLLGGRLTLSMLWSVLTIGGAAVGFYLLSLRLMRERLIR